MLCPPWGPRAGQAEQMLHGAEPGLVLLLMVAIVKGTLLMCAWVSPQNKVSFYFQQPWPMVKVQSCISCLTTGPN